jgi:hypothetical protein
MAVSRLDGIPAEPAAADEAPASPKWLMLGEAGMRWRLPDDTNLDHLEVMIRAAIRGGEPVSIEVQGDGTALRSCLVLNGRSLRFVVLSEGHPPRH